MNATRLQTWLAAIFGTALVGGGGGQTFLHAETLDFEGGHFHLYRIAASQIPTLQLVWRDEKGQPLQSFEGLRSYLSGRQERLVFATNAGIYERGPKPCGLTVCNSTIEVPLNLNPGEGNFYLQPNGVFFVDDMQRAGVVTAVEFPKLSVKPRIATQSGPILLRSGKFHPAFQITSPNRRQRSGVGVRKSDGEVVFLMSDREDRDRGRVTFHHLARAFKELGCEDALYLDGDISQMVTNPGNSPFTPNTFAAMFYISSAMSDE